MVITNSRHTAAAFAALLACLAWALHAGQPPIDWHEPVLVARGDARVGPWRMNESEFHYVDDPAVAVDRHGMIGMVWADQKRKDLFFQRFDTGGDPQLKVPVNVSRSPDVFSWLPRIVITDDDPAHVYVLWQEIVFSGGTHGGETFFARSTDGGRTFDNPINLSNSIAGDGKGRLSRGYWHNGSLDLIRGPAGELYTAWTEYEGRLWFSRSTDQGASFTDPLHVAGDHDTPARAPSLAAGADGTIFLAWTVGEDAAADIQLAVSSDAGRSFGGPRIVHDSDGHSDAPKLALDGEDTLHLAYGESPAGPLQRYHVRYTRSRDRGRTFETPKAIAGSHARRYDSVHFPALALDGEDNLYVIWELFPAGHRGRSQGLGFTHSGDGGRTFAPAAVIPGTDDPDLGINGSLQGSLMQKLAVSAAGAIAVVNSRFKAGEASRIRLIRGQRRE